MGLVSDTTDTLAEAARLDREDPPARSRGGSSGAGVRLAWNRSDGVVPASSDEVPQSEGLEGLWARLVGAPPGTCGVSGGSMASSLTPVLDRLAQPKGHRLGIVVFGAADADVESALAAWLERHEIPPARRLARVGPRLDEHCLRSEDAVDFLRRYGHEYAVAWVPAVDPLTGVPLDVAAVAAAGRRAGCVVCCDASAAVGGRTVELSDWDVDCAFWRASGYLGAFDSSGSVTYIREPCPEAQVDEDDSGEFDSLGAALRDALHAGPAALEARGHRLARFLRTEVERRIEGVKVIPLDEEARSSSLWVAVLVADRADVVVSELQRRHGVTAARLSPSVVALAPAPLATTFRECLLGATALASVLHEVGAPLPSGPPAVTSRGDGL